MVAPAAGKLYVRGQEVVARVGIGLNFSVTVLDADGTARDLSGDTLSAACKLDATAKTATLTADADQTNNTGLAHVAIAAAQIDATGTLYLDLKVKKSGGQDNTLFSYEITVVASGAE